MLISAYFASLSPLALFRALPGSIAQGLIWGLLALGVYITYKLLDFADLSVDGSFATGGAVAVMLIRSDMNPWVSLIFAFAAGMLAGMVTGLLHTKLGIPPILAGIYHLYPVWGSDRGDSLLVFRNRAGAFHPGNRM